MQFINQAPLYRVVRITGPKHNILGLELSEKWSEKPLLVERLDATSGGGVRLNEAEVVSSVLAGVGIAESEGIRPLHIVKIQYIGADSPPAEIYADLTVEILRRVDAIYSKRNAEDVPRA